MQRLSVISGHLTAGCKCANHTFAVNTFTTSDHNEALAVIGENKVKRRLKAGGYAFGCFLWTIRDPVVMKMLAIAGLDFTIICNEHAKFCVETTSDLCMAARYTGIMPVVRVADYGYANLSRSLDGGAQALMLPRARNGNEVRDVIKLMRYPARGNAQLLPYTNYGAGPTGQVLEQHNKEVMLIVQVETVDALDNLEDIASIEGVDCLLIGPNDLAIALGTPGQTLHATNPKLNAAMEKVLAVCKATGNRVAAGLHHQDPNELLYWAKKGYRMLSCINEGQMIWQRGKEIRSSVDAVFKNKNA